MTLSEKRDASLQLANTVRQERSKLKKDLKAGKLKVQELLPHDPPDYARQMTIEDLLLALPGFGRNRVRKVLTLSGISPSKHLGTLTLRQRASLAWSIRRHQPRSQK